MPLFNENILYKSRIYPLLFAEINMSLILFVQMKSLVTNKNLINTFKVNEKHLYEIQPKEKLVS